jgi:hypothetical protein
MSLVFNASKRLGDVGNMTSHNTQPTKETWLFYSLTDFESYADLITFLDVF